MRNRVPSEQEIEKGLETLFPQPRKEFLSRLECDLVREAVRQAEVNPSPQRPLDGLFNIFRSTNVRRFAVAFGVFTAAVILGLAAVGPQNVLAAVQKMLGYAPGVGFVDTETTRYLAAPVEVQRGDITVSIENVVADSEFTLVSMRVFGFAQKKFGPEEGNAGMPILLLPDGTEIESTSSVFSLGDELHGELTYPVLPDDVKMVTLVIRGMPVLPEAFAPGDWSIALPLQSAEEGANAEPFPMVTPYVPFGAEADTQGIAVRAAQAAESDLDTGVQVEFRWENPDWIRLEPGKPVLRDETGKIYSEVDQDHAPYLNFWEYRDRYMSEVFRFAPIESPSSELTLEFEEMSVISTSGDEFTFDPGNNPEPGQVWDTSQDRGMQFTLGGIPVKVLEVSIVEEAIASGDTLNGDSKDAMDPAHEGIYRIEFLLQAEQGENIRIDQFHLIDLNIGELGGYSQEQLPDGKFRLSFSLEELPQRSIKVQIKEVTLMLSGPWVLEWTREPGN